MDIELQFGGGAELLFNNEKQKRLTLPSGKTWTIRALLQYMKENLLQERPELFIQGETIRPGILILINDTDWLLLGELDYEIQPNDRIIFISTLHGG